MAGATGARVSAFLLYDAGGALLWAGAGVAAGMLFHRAIDRALSLLASLGSGALVVLAAALAVFVAFKWWQRRRFYQFLRMARITVDDLRNLIDAGKSPIVVDVRTAAARSADPRRIPGAVVMSAASRRRASRTCRASGRSSSTARDPTKPQPPVWRACSWTGDSRWFGRSPAGSRPGSRRGIRSKPSR